LSTKTMTRWRRSSASVTMVPRSAWRHVMTNSSTA
jgi:hypothetical protein